MTFGELKATVRSRLVGESKIALEDAAMQTFTAEALIRTANSCVPLKLLTRDIITHTPLRQVDESYYIRMPKTPTNDADKLDIDESLSLAIVYFVCAAIARNPNAPFEAMAQAVIDSHRWVAFDYLQKKEIVDELHAGW